VIVDGKAVNACFYLGAHAHGKKVTTIEGLHGDGEALHPLQQAFIGHYAVQCGFCIPGLIVAAKAFLDKNPPSHQGGDSASFGGEPLSLWNP